MLLLFSLFRDLSVGLCKFTYFAPLEQQQAISRAFTFTFFLFSNWLCFFFFFPWSSFSWNVLPVNGECFGERFCPSPWTCAMISDLFLFLLLFLLPGQSLSFSAPWMYFSPNRCVFSSSFSNLLNLCPDTYIVPVSAAPVDVLQSHRPLRFARTNLPISVESTWTLLLLFELSSSVLPLLHEHRTDATHHYFSKTDLRPERKDFPKLAPSFFFSCLQF